MSAFDELQDQLLQSIAQRAGRRPAHTKRQPSRWWTTTSGWLTRRRRGLLLLVIPLLFAAAAAAATIATRSSDSPVNALFNRVLTQTGSGKLNLGACRVVGGGKQAPVSEEAPDPRILAVLPQLATPPRTPPSPAAVGLAEHDGGGAVLTRTIREVHLPGAITLFVFVAHGEGGFTPVDPQRCLAARLAKLADLRPNPHDPLRVTVARKLMEQPDTSGLQTLYVFHSQRDLVGGGGSTALSPSSKTLSTGVQSWGYSCNPQRCSATLYTGIVRAATAYLTVAPAPHARSHGRRVHRRIQVVEGFFAFILPRNTGPELITERTHRGQVITTRHLPAMRSPATSQNRARRPRPR